MAAINVRSGYQVGSDELIQTALDALLDGLDTPALRRLAGLTRSEEPDAPDLFEHVIDELGLAPLLPDHPDDARWVLIRWYCELIVDRRLDAQVGGQRIWMLWHEIDDPTPLQPLIDVLAQWDDLLWTTGAFPDDGRRAVVVAAEGLLGHGGLPAGVDG